MQRRRSTQGSRKNNNSVTPFRGRAVGDAGDWLNAKARPRNLRRGSIRKPEFRLTRSSSGAGPSPTPPSPASHPSTRKPRVPGTPALRDQLRGFGIGCRRGWGMQGIRESLGARSIVSRGNRGAPGMPAFICVFQPAKRQASAAEEKITWLHQV
jgi:hypothetical protein